MGHKVAETMPMLNYKLTVDHENDEAVIRTDGLQFADYDPKSKCPKTSSVLCLSEAILVYALYTPHNTSGQTYREFREVMPGRTPFIVASRVMFYPAFFDSNMPKSPIIGRIRGGKVGNSSITFLSRMFTGSGLDIWSSAIKVICVDEKLRKAVPYPEWWRNKYERNSREHDHVDFKLLRLPTVHAKNRIRVVGSELDFHGHTNWSNYTKYAEDTIYFLTKRGSFQCLGDVNKLNLKSLELMHGAQTFEGDDLDVYVWQDSCEENVIIVQIYRDKTFIFQGRYEYIL